ncbi:MAG: TonB-dependent receptor [Bacteroidota bacterium]|nr:TonB-dependent receptor [Bacteroidota bacterium]
MSLNNSSLYEVIDQIKTQSGMEVSYDLDIEALKLAKISINVKDENIETVLDKVLKGTGIKYRVVDKIILLSKKQETKAISFVNPAPAAGNYVAQQYSVSGTVTDAVSGELLTGVSVFVEGTTSGVPTDIAGRYNIKVPNPNATLVFSLIGYTVKKVPLAGQKVVDVKLTTDAKNLEEVVVVGYGSQKKESVTAAISTISSKDLVQSPTANISNALAGRLSGLTAIQTSGKPGEDQSTLYIRGLGTYMGTTSPLIMVDGVSRDSYDNIDPNEIETISILKDASATAVFGVRGANGVILITTKRGTKSAPKVNLSAQTAMTRFDNNPRFANAYEWTSLKNEQGIETYWRNHGKDASITDWATFVTQRDANWRSEAVYNYTDQDLLYYKNAHTPTLADGTANPNYDPYFHPDTDWKNQIFKKYCSQSKVNVNINGGTDDVKYFISLGYMNQNGLFKTDYVPYPDDMNYRDQRYNLRSNFDFDINKDFRLSVDMGYQHEVIGGLDVSNGGEWLWWKRIAWSNPISSPGIVDGKFVMPLGNSNVSQNVLHEIAGMGYDNFIGSTLTSSVKGTYKLDFVLKGLAANARIAYDSYFKTHEEGSSPVDWYSITPNNGDRLHPKFILMNDPTNVYRIANRYDSKWRHLYAEAGLTYNRSFGKHDIGALGLYNVDQKYDPGLTPDLPHAYIGMVGRVTYGYDGRYLAEYNVGYNGSENFPSGKRFGFFPSYSLGWVVSKEPFFPENKIVTFLKFRGSMGKVGNDNVIVNGVSKRYLYLPDTWAYNTASGTSTYPFGPLTGKTNVKGAMEGTLGNPNVTWETATKTNVGFESKFFGDKLSVTYDYFNEHRTGILSYKGSVPAIVQATLPPYNLGEVKNWGFELEVSWRHQIGDLNYWVKGNYSHNKNKIVYQDEAITEGMEYQASTGRPINQNLILPGNSLYTSWADLYSVDGNGNPILSQPKPALNKQGKTYTNAAGNTVYQKDLGYLGYALQPGDVQLVDYNEDGVIDSKDYIRSGKTAIPENTFGFSFGFSYKGFDFSALLQGVTGVGLFPHDYPFLAGYSIEEPGLRRFTPERFKNGDDIQYPVASSPLTTDTKSEYFLKDASYLRLKNVEIGYTLKPAFLKKMGIQSSRIYVNGSNLYTWASCKVWGDPENLATRGYPLTQTFNLGLNINF